MKKAGVAFDKSAKAPQFEKFINEFCSGDAELVGFIREWMGRCLTGETSVHAVLLLFGNGRNGKTVLARVLQSLLGSYAVTLSGDFLMQSAKHSEQEMLDLRGARVAIANELPEGTFAEGRLKTISGGDILKGKAVYQKHQSFVNTAKLILLGNHKPTVRNGGDAIWARLEPFPCDFRPETPDPNLETKLLDELPGILNWAIEGLVGFMQKGHKVPARIEEERRAYRETEDVLGAFIEDCCIIYNGASSPKSEVYSTYQRWAREGGFFEMSQIYLTKRLRERGITEVRKKSGRFYSGIDLKR